MYLLSVSAQLHECSELRADKVAQQAEVFALLFEAPTVCRLEENRKHVIHAECP